ncbi:GNAT family N-acetyltransferase [Parasalinivibrio latis]|uniref:GNAT family N-acetyltransferase n=1 Tax=Parasalinivibrio latis TaxID=2952610 RepID=UPI0030E210CE
MEIKHLQSTDVGVETLINKSDQYLEALYPPESNHTASRQQLFNDCVFLGLYLKGKLAGMGAIKPEMDGSYAEIKRVFIDDEYRGRKLSIALMVALEQEARTRKIPLLRLETGIKQPEAIGLYHKIGYEDIPPFGEYSEDPMSVFMEKYL